jgi:hypothetical protein
MKVPKLRKGWYQPAFLARPPLSGTVEAVIENFGTSGFGEAVARLAHALAGETLDGGAVSELEARLSETIAGAGRHIIAPLSSHPEGPSSTSTLELDKEAEMEAGAAYAAAFGGQTASALTGMDLYDDYDGEADRDFSQFSERLARSTFAGR